MIQQELHDVGGRKVEVRHAGSGPPVLYLHSAIGEFWLPEFVEPLTERFEVICPAHPGFGESSGIEEISDIEDLAFHYDEVIGTLEIGRPHLIGLSIGGWIAAEYAVRWPEKISSLTLIDAAGLWVENAPIAQLWGIQPQELVRLLFEDDQSPLAQLLLSIDLDDPPPDEILLQFINNQAATAKIGWDPYLHDPKLASRLHRVTCPALVVWAENDRLVPDAHADRYASLLPNAQVHRVPGGHLAALENPGPTSEAISEFLRDK